MRTKSSECSVIERGREEDVACVFMSCASDCDGVSECDGVCMDVCV